MKRYYVRVSTEEQNVARQLEAYKDKEAVKYIDKMSGRNRNRVQLKAMLNDLQEGDTVIVKSIDRLSRSTIDLLNIVKEIEEKGAYLQVIDNAIDTSNAMGKFFLTMLGALGELEWANIRQRTKEGIAIAKKQGKFKGRKKGSITLKGEDKKRFIKLYELGVPKTELSKIFEVSRPTIYYWIDELNLER